MLTSEGVLTMVHQMKPIHTTQRKSSQVHHTKPLRFTHKSLIITNENTHMAKRLTQILSTYTAYEPSLSSFTFQDCINLYKLLLIYKIKFIPNLYITKRLIQSISPLKLL